MTDIGFSALTNSVAGASCLGIDFAAGFGSALDDPAASVMVVVPSSPMSVEAEAEVSASAEVKVALGAPCI